MTCRLFAQPCAKVLLLRLNPYLLPSANLLWPPQLSSYGSVVNLDSSNKNVDYYQCLFPC